jgi:S1-C subfamily serine protease
LHNPTNTIVSFGLLFSIVGISFYYVSANKPEEPWLGIEGSNVTPPIAQTIGLKEARGFLIFSVEETSPADTAGLRGGDRVVTIDGRPIVLGGDVIVAIDNVEIEGAEDIEALLTKKAIGDGVLFSVIRGNSSENFNVVLGAK